MPLPIALVKLLGEYRKQRDAAGVTSPYLFPTIEKKYRARGTLGGQPDGNMLDKLKLLAMGAGLNCGRCTGQFNRRTVSCRTHAICRQFGLHKFRHTYGTTLLQDGLDLKSLQLLLGHKELASTERYLHSLTPTNLLAKINATGLATKFVRAEVEPAELLEMTAPRAAVA